MKKFLTLIACALCYMSVNAQTWDFTQGLSDVTKANLAADATNWSTNRTDATTGVVTGWKNAKALSNGTVLTANGQTITEFEGILFNKCSAGNILLDPSSFRLGGKSETITIKGLKSGQTITIKAKSANATAENRALLCSDQYVTYTSGPTDGICYGGSATSATAIAELANAENGVFTLVWTVDITDDTVETIDVTIGTGSASGGIDIQSIKVSGGKADEDKNVAWIGDYGDFEDAKPMTGITYTNIPADSEISADSLRAFDAIILSPELSAGDAMTQLVEENIAYTPIVNLNADLFGYTSVDGAGTTLKTSVPGSDLYADFTSMSEEGTFEYAPVAYTLPERFASDDVLATNVDANAVAFHQHNAKRNTYIFIPTPKENDDAWSTNWNSIVSNAIKMAAATKKAVTKVAKPVVSQAYTDGETTVTIACSTAGSKIMYAIDEDEFQPYTEPFKMTAEGTVWAYTTAEGYIGMTEDEAVSTAIKVYTPAAAPEISYTDVEGTATVTITAEEGATIYYNFSGSEETASSMIYTEPFTVEENVTVSAFTVKEGYLNSSLASKEVTIAGYVPMTKILSHFDANKAEWANGESKAYYYCYLKGDNKKKYNLSEDYTCRFSPEGSDWALYTSGQQVVWESTSPQKSVGDVSNYNPVRVSDLIDFQATSGEITVGATGSTEQTVTGSDGADSTINVSDKPSFELVSTKKFQGPFQIVSYIGCKPGKVGFEYIVSEDSITWDTIATSPAGPTYEDSASKWRLWHRDLLSYNEAKAVYVKVKSISTDSYRIFDIIIRTKESSAKGDVNGDGSVDIADVNAIISVICGGTDNTAADVNADGSVDIADVNAVIGTICGSGE